MAVPTAITDLSTTAASNSPAGSEAIRPNLDDYLRAAFAFIAQNYASLATKQASLGYTPVNRAGDTMTGAQAFTAGTAAAPGITFSGDTNTGLHSSAADTLDLVTAGAIQWRVDSSGRLRSIARAHPIFRGVTSANITTTGDFTTYTSETDDGSNFNATTGVFTTPVAGWYEFTAYCESFLTSGDGQTGFRITDGSDALAEATIYHSNASASRKIILHSGPVYLSASTQVKATCVQASGTYTTIICRAFSGRLIG